MIALAVYAAVVTVLLIVAVCFLIVVVQEQKELVRRAVESRMAKRLATETHIAVGGTDFTFPGDLTDEQMAAVRDALTERARPRA